MLARRSPAVAVLLAAVALTAAACSKSTSGTSSTTTVPMATTRPPTTAPTTKPAPATTAAPKVGYFTPQQAADHLMGAWKAGDRIGAAQGASASAVADMFKVPPTPFTLYNYCEDPSLGQSGCLYRYGQATVQVNTKQHPEGWVVVSIFYSPN